MKHLGTFSVVVLTVAALMAAGPAADAGVLYFSQDFNQTGLYTLNTSTGLATPVGISGVTGSTVGLAPSASPALLYGSKYAGFLHINSDGSGAAQISSYPSEGLAYDPVNNICYGAWWNSGQFESINPATGTVITSYGTPPDDVEGLAYHNGIVYGLAGWGGNPRGNLWAFNVSTTTWSLIGNTGVPFDLCGLAYDPGKNALYAIGAQDNNLYQINPANAATTVIGPTGLNNTGGGLAYVADVIPEPCTIALLGLGGLAMLVRRRRDR